MNYGYERVSSRGQDRYGNSLQEQRKQLTAAGCDVIYSDSFTGTKIDRPEFSKLLAAIRPGDTLTVTKLDRFARSAADGAKLIGELVKRGINVHVLNMGKADDTPMGKLMTTILLAFAEFERDMIAERTAAGKAVAKANNPDWKEGRKRIDIPGFEKFRKMQKDGILTVSECCKQLGISRSTWCRRVREGA